MELSTTSYVARSGRGAPYRRHSARLKLAVGSRPDVRARGDLFYIKLGCVERIEQDSGRRSDAAVVATGAVSVDHLRHVDARLGGQAGKAKQRDEVAAGHEVKSSCMQFKTTVTGRMSGSISSMNPIPSENRGFLSPAKVNERHSCFPGKTRQRHRIISWRRRSAEECESRPRLLG